MRTLGNILWLLFGGIILGTLWGICGLLCCVTIIGIPFGIQCFKFAGYVLWPFGRKIHYKQNIGHFILNILWILFCGWELAIASLAIGLVWCVTIIGIPFGIQSMKFAKLAFMPFGAEIQ